MEGVTEIPPGGRRGEAKGTVYQVVNRVCLVAPSTRSQRDVSRGQGQTNLCVCVHVYVCVLSHVRLFANLMDCGLPGSSIHGIFQARTLERVAISFSRQTCTYYLFFGRFLAGASQVALVVKNPPANAGDLRDVGLIPRSGRSPGEGHGNSVQYSCLENPMDRGAWWATVYGVAKSQTRLKWLSTHKHTHTFHCLCQLRKEIEEMQKREQCVTLRESCWRGNKDHKLITAVLLVLQAFLVFTMYRTFSVDR